MFKCAILSAEYGTCRKLIMMRHAESEERLQSIRDHDRPITDEGRSSAREVGFCILGKILGSDTRPISYTFDNELRSCEDIS